MKIINWLFFIWAIIQCFGYAFKVTTFETVAIGLLATIVCYMFTYNMLSEK